MRVLLLFMRLSTFQVKDTEDVERQEHRWDDRWQDHLMPVC